MGGSVHRPDRSPSGIISTALRAVAAVIRPTRRLPVLNALHECAAAVARGAGCELLDLMFQDSRRSHWPLAIALVDLGLVADNAISQSVIRSLNSSLRNRDVLILWGGEELLLALPDTSSAEATALLADIWRSGRCQWAAKRGRSASIGLAERYADAARDWRQLISLANARMTAARRRGRDCINAPYDMSHLLVESAATTVPELDMTSTGGIDRSRLMKRSGAALSRAEFRCF